MKFNGVIRFNSDLLSLPMSIRKPTVFSVWNDFFHPRVQPDDQNQALFVMVGSSHHKYLILTKQAEVMKHFIEADSYLQMEHRDYTKHIYFGVTAENQERADERIPTLLSIPGIKRFMSLEPLLGPVKFRWTPYFWQFAGMTYREYLEKNKGVDQYESLKLLDGVIVGGESGPKARPCKPEWIRSIIEQCRVAGVPCFVKQLGNNDGTNRHRSKRADEETIRKILGECPRELPWDQGER